ncbi:MAG: hypothetical protein Q4B22_05325, partial [Eubacteriales bacterium]|nr:hypothetical protein [Eubacteriales bacterium]
VCAGAFCVCYPPHTVTTHTVTAASTTNTTDSSTQTGSSGTQTQTAPAQTVTTQTVTAAQTGYFDQVLPFMIALGSAGMVFWIALHFLLNQVRAEKAEFYTARRAEARNRK